MKSARSCRGGSTIGLVCASVVVGVKGWKVRSADAIVCLCVSLRR